MDIRSDILENDPTRRLKKDDFGKKVERERILSSAEIKSLPEMLNAARLAETSRCAVWIMLSTCCRVGEITRPCRIELVPWPVRGGGVPEYFSCAGVGWRGRCGAAHG